VFVTVITVLHVIISVLLILVVLLQTGKGSEVGAILGGGAGQTLFGSTGGKTFFTKVTTVLAVAFMLSSLYLATHGWNKQSPLQKEMQKQTSIPLSEMPAPESSTPSSAENPASSGTAQTPAPVPAPAGK